MPKGQCRRSSRPFTNDGDWFVGYCPEVPGANGQGRTKDECRKNLAAVELILEDRLADALGSAPENIEREPLLLG